MYHSLFVLLSSNIPNGFPRDYRDLRKRHALLEGSFGHLLQLFRGFSRLVDKLLQDRLLLAQQQMRFVKLGDVSGVEDEDAVGIHDRLQPMRHR